MIELLLSERRALITAIAALIAVIFLLRKNRGFLAVFIVLALCRYYIALRLSLGGSSHAALASVLGAARDMIFILPFAFIPSQKWSSCLTTAAMLVVLGLNGIDAYCFYETTFRVHKAVFDNINILALTYRLDLLAAFLLFVAALAGVGFFVQKALRLAENRKAVFVTLLACLSVFAANIHPQYKMRGAGFEVFHIGDKNELLTYIGASAVANFSRELTRGMWSNNDVIELSSEEIEELKALGLYSPASVGSQEAFYDRVIIVFFESLSYPLLNGFDATGERAEMPFFNGLKSDHVSLENYYSSASTTCEGMAAFLASYPMIFSDKSNRDTLYSLAKANGYNSAEFYSSSAYYRNKIQTHKQLLKVDHTFGYEADMGFHSEQPLGWGIPDETTFEKALLWIGRNRHEKLIVSILTTGTHPPYEPAEALPRVDAQLAFFVQGLEEQGLLDERTLLIITADHHPTHGANVLEYMHLSTFMEDTRLPLLMISKNIEPLDAMEKNRLSSPLDMAPTLGALLGLPESNAYLGTSLLAEGAGKVFHVDRSGNASVTLPGQAPLHFNLDTEPEDSTCALLWRWYHWKNP